MGKAHDRMSPSRRLTAALALVCAALQTHSATAQEKLDLYAAMAEVDASHPLASAKRQEFSAAEKGLSAAKQQRLPSLSVQSSRANAIGASTLQVARLQQPLFAGGRIDAGIERSESLIAEAKANADATRRDLMTRTAGAFIEVIKGQARLKIADRSVAEHARLLDSIDRRVGAEVSPESDLLLTRSRLSQAQTERTQIMLTLRRAQDTLSELLNRPLPILIEPPPRAAPSMDLQAALDAAVGFAPEVQRAIAQESVASNDVDVQRSYALPSVFARHEQLIGELSPGFARSQTYVGLEFVPGAGFSVASQIQAAESRRRAAIETRKASEKDARDRVRGLWAESQSLKGQLESAQAYVRSAQSVSDSFARQFTIGRKSWLEVLNAIREGLLAELSLADIQWSLRLSELRLEIETGKLTMETIASAPQAPVAPNTQNESPR